MYLKAHVQTFNSMHVQVKTTFYYPSRGLRVNPRGTCISSTPGGYLDRSKLGSVWLCTSWKFCTTWASYGGAACYQEIWLKITCQKCLRWFWLVRLTFPIEKSSMMHCNYTMELFGYLLTPLFDMTFMNMGPCIGRRNFTTASNFADFGKFFFPAIGASPTAAFHKVNKLKPVHTQSSIFRRASSNCVVPSTITPRGTLLLFSNPALDNPATSNKAFSTCESSTIVIDTPMHSTITRDPLDGILWVINVCVLMLCFKYIIYYIYLW